MEVEFFIRFEVLVIFISRSSKLRFKEIKIKKINIAVKKTDKITAYLALLTNILKTLFNIIIVLIASSING